MRPLSILYCLPTFCILNITYCGDEEDPGCTTSTWYQDNDGDGLGNAFQNQEVCLQPEGIIADGFFLYGRKCNSSGTYPTDLDASGGHTSTTQHTKTADYHYHIENEVYLNEFHLLFSGDYQDTANSIL